MGLYLAAQCGARVTGVTLSDEQLAIAQSARADSGLADRRRIPAAGLSRRDRALRPHRLGRHVRACRRRPITTRSSSKVARLLDARWRRAAAHDRPARQALRDQSVHRGNTSSRAAICRRCRRSCRRSSARDLIVTDIEVLRLHYAETLQAWRERFLAHRDEIARALRRAVLPHVGVLSRRARKRRSGSGRAWSSRSR